ncbi:MAG: hypothetical protein D6791_06970 [Chloroflexi bacterium]|nr:MAG: hypothetical protein D6791_06970 [Chloroflexota bacterium]
MAGDHQAQMDAGQPIAVDDRITFVPYDQAYEEGFEDMRRRVPDTSKIRAVIGWEPQISLDETLRRIIGYYQGRQAGQ